MRNTRIGAARAEGWYATQRFPGVALTAAAAGTGMLMMSMMTGG